MQRFMLGVDRMLRRRRRLVLILWGVSLLVAMPFAAMQNEHLTGGGFGAPGSQSDEVEQAIKRDYPGVGGATLVAVLVPQDGARPADLRAAVARVDREVAGVDDVRVLPAARRAALASARARPDRTVLIPLDVPGGEQTAIDVGRDVRKELDIKGSDPGELADGKVNAHVVGQGALWAAFQDETKENVTIAEARAFPLIAIVLLAAFGSLAAAALPLGLGFAAVLASGALIFALSLVADMSIFVTNIVSMIGIGIAVDYSLFVLARYREEVRGGRTAEQARATALATSGVAVIFSGLTVAASMAGLFVVDSQALQSMAVGAMIVVAVSLLGSATLLPVLIAVLGDRAHEPGRLARAYRRRRGTERTPDQAFWARWTRTVMRRPVISVLLAAAVLLTLAIPALDLNMSNSALRQLDSDHEFRAGVEAAASVAGPGAIGPATVHVRFADGTVRDAANRRTQRAVTRALERDPGVRRVTASRTAQDGRSALLTTVLRTDPEAPASRKTVERLRDTLPAATGGRAEIAVGGTTAVLRDFDHLVSTSLWKIGLFVLALSFLVLLVLLRSVVLPLKGVLMNILSIAAAYGVLVAVFQWGWLGFLGLAEANSVDTITPPLVLAIAFGLSMDYQVFLLSRIRERYAITGDNRRAVAEGLASSAHTITSAAVIMVVVFIAFVSAGLPSVQRLGVACAAAIAIDATIVRLVLVPASMELLGKWNWWLPRPLARILPTANLEQVRVGLAPDGSGAVEAGMASGDGAAGADGKVSEPEEDEALATAGPGASPTTGG